MNSNFEKLRFFWTLAAAASVGLLTGYMWQSIVLALVGYIIWMLTKLFELDKWLNTGADINKAPYASGLWGRTIGHIVKLRNQQGRSKKNYQKLMIRFNEIIRSFPYPTVVVNGNSEIQWMSKSAGKILGLNRKKDIGIRISNILRNSEFQTMLSKSELSEFQMLSPANKDVVLAIAISKLTKDTRILSIRDVSDRRRLEKLRKGFIANASHELRTPLTIINGYLEMLESHDKLSDEAKSMVDNAYQQSKRMNILISDLLTLSSLENSEMQVNKFVEVDMSALIQEISANIKNAISFSGEVQLDLDKNLVVHGVYSQLYSIVFNLMENAAKYSKDSISANWKLVDELPTFEVIDNGAGISQIDQARLIEPFFRTQEAQAAEIQGTGLGLSIVHQAAIKNKARLEIESEKDKGSIFRIIFES